LNKEHIEELYCLYNTYNGTIKPLIALIEARYERFPQPIPNEIRAFNDHIAQCYRKEVSDEYITEELNRANRHIKRIIFDCFKFLNVSLNDFVVQFENQTKKVDLTTINNGEFIIKYRKLRAASTSAVRDAKRLEPRDNQQAFKKYEEAFNLYMDLEDFINENVTSIQWARAKFTTQRFAKIVLWVLSAVISGIISSLIGINYNNVKELLASIF
jgi:hypothetical protein